MTKWIKILLNSKKIYKKGTNMKNKIDDLSPIQRKVALENGTEPPFKNEYWNHFEEGLYVDILDGTPLFTSKDKFESDCGWPSFAKPISTNEIVEKKDISHFMIRTEVRSQNANIHLGHVFNDGPKALGGLRYCINSASLKFIPLKDLDEAGYGEYKYLFK